MWKRPTLTLLLLLLPGIIAADRTEPPPALAFGAPAGAILFFLLSGRRKTPLAGRVALLALPSLLFSARTAAPPPLVFPEKGIPVVMRGTIGGRGGAPRTVLFRPSEGTLAGRTLTLRPPFDEPAPNPGERVVVEGALGAFPFPRNPGEPDRFALDRRRGRTAFLHARTIDVRARRSPLGPIRSAIREAAERIGGREEGLFLALFLADRSALDPETVDAFRTTGLSHLLALSGLHLAILYGVAAAPLSLVLGRRWTPPVAVAILWGFGAAASFPVSLFRALVMASLLAAGRLLGRPVDRWNTLGAAALAAIAADGAAPWDLSFRLSFAATAGILAILPLAARLSGRWWGRFLAAPLLVSLAAQAATLPVVLHHFGVYAPAGAPATLLATPFTALSLAAGSAWLTAGQLHPAADRLLGDAAWGSLALLRLVVDRAVSTLPGPVPFSAAVADRAALFLLLLLPVGFAWRAKRFRAPSLLLLLLPLLPARDPYPLRLTILDVGQGSAAVAELPGGERILFDAGPRSPHHDAGQWTVLPFLRRRGAARLDLLAISHPDADHAGGAVAILDRTAPRFLLDCGLSANEPLPMLYDSTAEHSGTARMSARCGGRFVFGRGATLDVLFAPEGRLGEEEGSNASSVVLLLRYERFSALFPGDTTPAIERHLARAGLLDPVTVLVAPHHGAKGGCTTEFLRELRPAVAVISAGQGNRYGHPDPSVLVRLRAAGCQARRTDLEGAITIRTDGRRVFVQGTLPGSPEGRFSLGYRPRRDHAGLPLEKRSPIVLGSRPVAAFEDSGKPNDTDVPLEQEDRVPVGAPGRPIGGPPHAHEEGDRRRRPRSPVAFHRRRLLRRGERRDRRAGPRDLRGGRRRARDGRDPRQPHRGLPRTAVGSHRLHRRRRARLPQGAPRLLLAGAALGRRAPRND